MPKLSLTLGIRVAFADRLMKLGPGWRSLARMTLMSLQADEAQGNGFKMQTMSKRTPIHKRTLILKAHIGIVLKTFVIVKACTGISTY